MDAMTEDEIILEMQTFSKNGGTSLEEIKKLKEILRSNPNSRYCLDHLATLHREQEMYREEANYLRKLIHLCPNPDDKELLEEARKCCNQKLKEL